MSTESGIVHFERRGTIAAITFDRQAARNAMSWAMYAQLEDALNHIASDSELRVAVLRGAGGHFVAGTDIAQFADFTSGEDGVAYERRLEAVLARLESIHVATIAAVQGYAAGGGLALALACDVRVCTPDARFGVPIAKTVGNCLSMANTARLVANVGAARARAMLFTAEFLSADEALALGFVAEVVDQASFDERVDALATKIAAHAPVTLQVTREAIRRIVDRSIVDGDDLVRRAYGSTDFHEGVAAFMQKRAPRWEGR